MPTVLIPTTSCRDGRQHSCRPSLLLIDADDPSRADWPQLLGDAGFQVTVARSGFEGIVKASCQLPDVVVMDLTLAAPAGVDGWAAAELLRNCPATAKIPVLGLTRALDEDARRRAEEAQCTLIAAQTLQELLTEINRTLTIS